MIRPIQTRQFSLNFDAARLQHPWFILVVFGFENDFAARTAEAFEGHFSIVDQRHHDRAVFGGFGFADDDDVAVVDAGVDHRVAAVFAVSFEPARSVSG